MVLDAIKAREITKAAKVAIRKDYEAHVAKEQQQKKELEDKRIAMLKFRANTKITELDDEIRRSAAKGISELMVNIPIGSMDMATKVELDILDLVVKYYRIVGFRISITEYSSPDVYFVHIDWSEYKTGTSDDPT